MLIRDFMSYDAGDGCRGTRRNAARSAYRAANAAAVFLNRHATPEAATPAADTGPRRLALPLGMLGGLALGMLAPRRVAATAPPAPTTPAVADPAPTTAPAVADFDAEKTARERAAKDRKNEAARKRRADKRAALAAAA